MNFEFSEDQKLIRNSVRDFASRYIAPGVKERDAAKKFPHDLVKKLADQGLMGMVHPEKYNGGGVDNVSYCLMLEEIARWDASLALTVASHHSLASGHIALAGNEKQKEKYLSKLTTGEALGAWCLTEPGSGSDASGMKTTAVKNRDKWIINGSKIFITQGTVGDIYVVLAKTDPDKQTKGISGFIVEKTVKVCKPAKWRINWGCGRPIQQRSILRMWKFLLKIYLGKKAPDLLTR